MDRPLEISFHNMDVSPSLEADIRSHVDRLEQRYGRLVGCRVAVEKLQNRHRTGNLFDVHVVMSVPGQELAVSREAKRAKEKYARPDVRTSLRDAFAAAERQLTDHKWRQRDDTSRPSAHALPGQVTQIEPGADYGFILTNNGTQLYFHRDSVTDGRFEDLQQGASVQYVEEAGDAGPTATKIRIGNVH